MEWIGKGLGTIGIWGGCAAVSYFSARAPLVPLIIVFTLFMGLLGTVAIWCPENIKKIINGF